MEFITYVVIIPLVVGFLFSFARRQSATKEKNMSKDEFTIKFPAAFPLFMYAGGLFFAVVGVYFVLNPTEVNPVETGLSLIAFGSPFLFLGLVFEAYKIKLDKHTVSSTHLFRRKAKVVNLSDVALVKYENKNGSESITAYNSSNEKLFRAESIMTGFKLLLIRTKELNCEFVEK